MEVSSDFVICAYSLWIFIPPSQPLLVMKDPACNASV